MRENLICQILEVYFVFANDSLVQQDVLMYMEMGLQIYRQENQVVYEYYRKGVFDLQLFGWNGVAVYNF